MSSQKNMMNVVVAIMVLLGVVSFSVGAKAGWFMVSEVLAKKNMICVKKS